MHPCRSPSEAPHAVWDTLQGLDSLREGWRRDKKLERTEVLLPKTRHKTEGLEAAKGLNGKAELRLTVHSLCPAQPRPQASATVPRSSGNVSVPQTKEAGPHGAPSSLRPLPAMETSAHPCF